MFAFMWIVNFLRLILVNATLNAQRPFWRVKISISLLTRRKTAAGVGLLLRQK